MNGSAHKATLDTALRMAVFKGARGDRSIMVTEETVAWGLVNLGLAAPTPCKFPFPRGIPRKGVNASATTAHVSKTTSFMDISNNLDDQRLAAHNLEQEGQARQGQFEINGLAPVHQWASFRPAPSFHRGLEGAPAGRLALASADGAGWREGHPDA